MSKAKTQRLENGTWLRDGKRTWFYAFTKTLARLHDNSAIEQQREYSADTIKWVKLQLDNLAAAMGQMSPSYESVKMYVNTHIKIVGRDGYNSMPALIKQEKAINKTLLTIK